MKKIELDTKGKYSDASIYSPERISASLSATGADFSSLLLREKAGLLLSRVDGRRVLDLGCGNGRHLSELSQRIEFGVGVDFSAPFIRFAAEAFASRLNLGFVVADVRALPLRSRSFDVAYSFGSLYYVDDIDDVYAELRRVLAAGGSLVLELGNARSLSTIVSRHYPNLAHHSRCRIGQHLKGLRRHGFDILDWRSYQILPMWGDQPRWLRPLRNPRLEKLMVSKLRGRMLDEWISSSPVIRRFAFRHLVVARAGSVN